VARIVGCINYTMSVTDANGPGFLINVRSEAQSYNAMFRRGPALAVEHLFDLGQTVTLVGVVSRLDDTTQNVDVVEIELEVDGKLQRLDVGYLNEFAPSYPEPCHEL
jgi:hypothetical protein